MQYWRSMAHLSCRWCNFSIGASSGLCWNGYACVVSDPIGHDVPSARFSYRQRLTTQSTEKLGVGVQMHRKSAFLLHCDSIGHICCAMALTASRCSTLHKWTNPQRLASSAAEFPLILLSYAWSAELRVLPGVSPISRDCRIARTTSVITYLIIVPGNGNSRSRPRWRAELHQSICGLWCCARTVQVLL